MPHASVLSEKRVVEIRKYIKKNVTRSRMGTCTTYIVGRVDTFYNSAAATLKALSTSTVIVVIHGRISVSESGDFDTKNSSQLKVFFGFAY